MREVVAAAFLQLILCISGLSPPPGAVEHSTGPFGQCLILVNGSVAVNGLAPVDGSYVCNAPSEDNPTQGSVQLHVIVMALLSPSSEGDTSLAGGCRVWENGSVSLHGTFLAGVGSYNCSTNSPNRIRTVSLQVLGSEKSLFTSITPTTLLPNGTLVAYRGSNVSLNCSGSSFSSSTSSSSTSPSSSTSSSTSPLRTLSWGFRGAGPSNASLASGGGAWLGLLLPDIQPSAQGEYWCESQSSLSSLESHRSTQQLLVYYMPAQHPDCLWKFGQDPTEVQFNCSWFGAYPTPKLRWAEIHRGRNTAAQDHLYVSGEADSLAVTLNRSLLFEGQMLKCIAEHPALPLEEHKSCLLSLKLPFPEGKPLVTALKNSDVTLTCTEASSVPPATTAWRRGEEQGEIVPGPKYQVSTSGSELLLTILNVSQADGGAYFCRSENPLAVRELEVFLTVKDPSTFTGAIMGIFIAALIVGTGAIVAKLVYSSRDRICLGNGFGRMEEERGDVISLVESEDDVVFQDTVPRLPPLTENGHHTTHAQIHPIPIGEDDDVDSVGQRPQQQEDRAEFEDPLQLITF